MEYAIQSQGGPKSKPPIYH